VIKFSGWLDSDRLELLQRASHTTDVLPLGGAARDAALVAVEV
jgi:hypothetical protein